MLDEPIENMSNLLKDIEIYLRPTQSDGDSLLVRDALCAGCRVLASDVVPRPKGVITFHDVDDCVLQLQAILKKDNIHGVNSQDSDFYGPLVGVYEAMLKI
jgi:hypothetical protein